MGMQASIDVKFSMNYEPGKILESLYRSGWNIDYRGDVTYLEATDIDDYDWKTCSFDVFDIDEFISLHSAGGRIGVVMTRDDGTGGEFLIFPDWVSLSISINRVYIQEGVPDFTWYVSMLSVLVEEFSLTEFECKAVF